MNQCSHPVNIVLGELRQWHTFCTLILPSCLNAAYTSICLFFELAALQTFKPSLFPIEPPFPIAGYAEHQFAWESALTDDQTKGEDHLQFVA